MEAAIGPAHKLVSASTEWEEAYRPLPLLYFGFLMVWSVLVCSWTLNTWNKRRWQDYVATRWYRAPELCGSFFTKEMNEKDFNNLDFKEWHIGVPTSTSRGDDRRPMLVIVLQPSMSNLELSKDIHSSKEMPRIIEKSFGHNSSFYNGKRSSLSQTCSSSLASDCTLTVEGRSQTSSQNSFSGVPNGTNETKYYKMKKTLNPIAMPLRRVA